MIISKDRTGKVWNPPTPVMLERPIGKLCLKLSELPWLDNIFGLAQRLKRGKDKGYYAGYYDGGDEYLGVLPEDKLGNRSFFILKDPEIPVDGNLEMAVNLQPSYKATVSLILWYDLRDIAGLEYRQTEEVKRQVLEKLNMAVLDSGDRMAVTKIFQRFENVFSDFTLEETNLQYVMSPYAGLRIDMDITYLTDCKQ